MANDLSSAESMQAGSGKARPTPSVLEIVKKSTEFLAAKGIDLPRLNAEMLVGHALGLGRMQLYLQFERVLTEPELALIRPLIRRRGLAEPVQYIIGTADFHGLKLKVDRRALIPRPETEQLVEQAIARLTVPPASILDLGTGSGAIALAMARHFAESRVTAVESRVEALELARLNADSAGLKDRVTFLDSSWFSAVPAAARFDLIISNPPYLSESEVAATAAEVRNFEPKSALVGGGDAGIDDLGHIVRGAPSRLAAGGLLALETGPSQHAALLEIAQKSGFSQVESAKDLAKLDRFLFARI